MGALTSSNSTVVELCSSVVPVTVVVRSTGISAGRAMGTTTTTTTTTTSSTSSSSSSSTLYHHSSI